MLGIMESQSSRRAKHILVRGADTACRHLIGPIVSHYGDRSTHVLMTQANLSLAGSATTTIFVATKLAFVATTLVFVSRKPVIVATKSMFVATKIVVVAAPANNTNVPLQTACLVH